MAGLVFLSAVASIATFLPESRLGPGDRVQVTVVASKIIPGNVVYVKSGNKLPADVRFTDISSDAKFD